MPPSWKVEIPVPGGTGTQHLGILRNFSDAIVKGEPLIAPAQEGIHSVELANAMLFSSLREETLELPLDGDAYAAELQRLCSQSRFRKRQVREELADDFR